MCRLALIAGLLAVLIVLCKTEENLENKTEKTKDDDLVLLEVNLKEKRSPVTATGIYGSSPNGQFVIRHNDNINEQQQIQQQIQIPPEYLAFIQRYVATQRQQNAVQRQHHQPRLLQQSAANSGQLLQSVETINQQQEVEIPIEQYHIETSPRRPLVRPPIYYAPEHQHQSLVTPSSISPSAVTASPPQPSQRPPQLQYHQSIPIQHYGFENDPEQVRIPSHPPSQAINAQLQSQLDAEAQARAQAQANAAALEFQKIAHAAHVKHTQSALEQIRQNDEKYILQQQQQSALDQIKDGERLSEAEISQRVPPKSPEEAYKARLKSQATALVAEQRRAQEASEYKAHADAILKLQATQEAHLRAQEESHRHALNFERNQILAQERAQALANAQAIALYQARQEAVNKAQEEASVAAKQHAEAGKKDPEHKHTPVVQYLLPNVPLPAPEVYLPRAQKIFEEHQKAILRHQQQVRQQKQQQQPQSHYQQTHYQPQPAQQHVPRKQLAVLVEQPLIEHQRPQQTPHLIRIPVVPKTHIQHHQPQQQSEVAIQQSEQPQLTREELEVLLNALANAQQQQQSSAYLNKKQRLQQQYARPTQAEYLAYQESIARQ